MILLPQTAESTSIKASFSKAFYVKCAVLRFDQSIVALDPLGGQIKVIVSEGTGHYPTSPKDPQPVVDFILAARR